jgi:hypothetical protein
VATLIGVLHEQTVTDHFDELVEANARRRRPAGERVSRNDDTG